MKSDNILLELCGIGKKFGGLTALSDISLSIKRGEIYGLIGPNGAGKTTLFNIITGLYSLDEGSFKFDGNSYTRCKPNVLAEAGITRTFQNIRLFPNMSALENVMIGRHVRTRSGIWGALTRHRAARVEEQAIARHAALLLDRVGFAHDPNILAKHLPYGDQRRLEIARALATEPKLLALDEPAAGMNATETQRMKALLQSIRLDGITILLIEHDVKLMMDLCDRMAVLNFGKLIAEGEPQAVRHNAAVIDAYLGTSTVRLAS